MKDLRWQKPVLSLWDASPAARNAAWRAGLIARDCGVPLRLLHAALEADEAPQALLQLRDELAHRLRTPVALMPAAGDPLAAAVRAAGEASLLVMGAQHRNPLRDFVLGTQAERLIRLSRAPVLVVKQAATASYKRVLVPVDLDLEMPSVIAAAGRLSRDPSMEILHALHTHEELTMRVADVPEAVLRQQRARTARDARAKIGRAIDLAASPGAGPPAAHPAVGIGDAASVVLARERAIRAELIVMGKRHRGLLAEFLLGSVTQRVVAKARADVMVLPVVRASPQPVMTGGQRYAQVT